MRKTMIFGFRSVPKQLECMYEIAISKAQDGNTVQLMWGAEDIHFCENYTLGRGGKTSLNNRPFYKIFDVVNKQLASLELNDYWLKTPYLEHPQIKLNADSVFDYFSLKAGHFEIGAVAISVITSYLNIDVTKISASKVNSLFEKVVSSMVNVYDKAKVLLSTEMPDEVVVFNGRFGPEAAVAHVAQALNIPVRFYEVIHDKNAYILWDFPVHSIVGQKSLVNYFWENGGDDKVGVAKAWVEKRLTSKKFKLNDDLDMVFDKNNESLIEKLSLSDKFVVFFQSSDDEYMGVSSTVRAKRPWLDQGEALDVLENAIGGRFQLVVRIHPHMQLKQPIERQYWRELAAKKPHVRFIYEDEPVDSYALGKASEFVVTGGDSTVGAEMLYLGVPVVCMSEALYDDARGCLSPCQSSELADIDLSAVSVCPEDVLPYFYFRATYAGTPCKYTKFGKGWSATFLGENYFV